MQLILLKFSSGKPNGQWKQGLSDNIEIEIVEEEVQKINIWKKIIQFMEAFLKVTLLVHQLRYW